MTTLFAPPPAEAHHRARSTDPPTSKEAARRAVTASAPIMAQVEQVMRDGKPRIAEQIEDAVLDAGLNVSRQAIRVATSDLHELRRLEYIVRPDAPLDAEGFDLYETARNRRGRRCMLHRRAST